MRINAYLLVVSVFLSTGAAMAEQPVWHDIGRSDEDKSRHIFIDLKNIKRKGNIAQFWSLVDYNEPVTGPEGVIWSMVSYEEIDCENNISSLKYLVGWSEKGANGKIIVQGDPQHFSKQIVPGTVPDMKRDFVCK